MPWHDYFFWLLLISLGCFVLERLRPWRPAQRALRTGFVQDLFWLVFNGHFAGVLLAYASAFLLGRLGQALDAWHLPRPESFSLIARAPLWAQFVVFLVLKDLIEWCIHNLLHRVSWLWQFHKLHHSILELDFLGAFRFHWMESVVYKSLSYLPLVILGTDGRVIFWVALFGTLIGHLNHSNLDLSFGPLRYVLNSPRMHVWHHDAIVRGFSGQNFGIIFSLWDFLFGTAYLPPPAVSAGRDQPAALGFEGIDRFPIGVPARLVYPWLS